MKRTEWKFMYNARELQEAATKKRSYHEGRQKWWEEERDKAKAALKEKGVDFREVPVTGGVRMDMVADQQLQMRYGECANKVDQHKAAAKEYMRWEALLQHAAENKVSLEINPDDASFFGIGVSDEDFLQ